MRPNSIVVVSLQSPREQFLGRLIDISVAGVTIRGIDLNAFEDWMTHIREHEENGVQPATTFFPLHRIEKITVDEALGSIPSLSETFLLKVGKTVTEHLE
jgi:hypothetical protein